MNFVNIPGWELQQFLTNTAKYARQTMAMIGIIIGIVTLVWGMASIICRAGKIPPLPI